MLKETLNKGISTPIAIAIVLILVIIVGSFAWLRYERMWRETSELPEIELPEKDETADWKTYRSEEYGYEIEYPTNYYHVEQGGIPSMYQEPYFEPIKYLEVIDFRSKDDNSFRIEIDIRDNANSLSVDEWIDFQAAFPLGKDPTTYRKPVTIAGVEGIEGLHRWQGLACAKGVFLPKEGKIYNLELNGYGCEESETQCCFREGEEEIFNQMLSTFKFLD